MKAKNDLIGAVGDKVRSIRRELILINLALIALGILMMVFPGQSTAIICRCIGAVLVIWGTVRVIAYFAVQERVVLGSFGLVQGTVLLGFGICFLVRPELLAGFLTIALAIILLAAGVMKLQYAMEMATLQVRFWWIELAGAVLMVVLGVIALFSPFAAAETLTIFLGASCAVSGVWDLVSVAALSAQVRRAKGKAAQLMEDANLQADATDAEFYHED